ncbi:hypothetical protein Pen01_28320 [Phytomonospora endophytica]|nr:hypothetical protein Pen01_28320 [Phytomonospora endophytica]
MASVVLAFLGIVLPFLPIDLTGVRAFIALPLGLAGLAAAIVGLTGNRRGRPVAVAGIVLSVLVAALGAWMIALHVDLGAGG